MELPKISVGQAVLGASVIGGISALGVTTAVIRRRKKSRKRKTSRNKNIRKKVYRNKKRKLKFGSKAYRKKYLKHGRKKPHTAGKRKDTSHRRIRYTKNNQPYILLRSGKSKFISKRSVSSSRKRKGGKY